MCLPPNKFDLAGLQNANSPDDDVLCRAWLHHDDAVSNFTTNNEINWPASAELVDKLKILTIIDYNL